MSKGVVGVGKRWVGEGVVGEEVVGEEVGGWVDKAVGGWLIRKPEPKSSTGKKLVRVELSA